MPTKLTFGSVGVQEEYFPIGMNTPIVYRAGHIDSALPLRLAVMYAPHR